MKTNKESQNTKNQKNSESKEGLQKENLIKLSARDIEARINSKSAFIEIFGLRGQYYLPPSKAITW